MATSTVLCSTLILLLKLVLISGLEKYPVVIYNHEDQENIKATGRTINTLDYRLPTSITPVSYLLEITDINFRQFTFHGTCTITAYVKESVKVIVLNARNIAVNANAVLENRKNVEIEKYNQNDKNERFNIYLTRNLTVKSTIKISLSFNGKLGDDMLGFYRSFYYNDKGERRWLAATQFEATNARSAFPCFDEPNYKAIFKINIKVPDGYNCLSNMKCKFNNNTRWCHFEKSPKMSTYVVAFIISDFQTRSTDESSVKLWSRSNAVSQSLYGQKIGVKALKILGNLFGVDYFKYMKKLDMVALPNFSAGAMENWGLITYRESCALYDETHSPNSGKERVASVIVHECTHMWLGNLVTPEWWSYLWLSEGFARYFQYMATDMVDATLMMGDQFVVAQFQSAMASDGVEKSPPLTRKIVKMITPAEFHTVSGIITYSKGASIVRMMEKTFGSEVFINALRRYIKYRKFRTVRPDNFWQALQRFANPDYDVATIMRTWTEQSGYPYITVTVKPDRIKLRQDRFLLRESSSAQNQSWWVPITLSSSSHTSNSTKPVFWLSKREDEIMRNNREDNWLIANVQSAGFYRVNYDKDSWNRIIKLLTSGDFQKIHADNRAAIVDDLLNLARVRAVDYELVFRGISYLKREKHYSPFKPALRHLDYLTRVTAETSNYNILKDFIMSLIENVYDELTFNDKVNDDQLTILLRTEILNRACRFADVSCIQKSRDYFNDWKNNNKLLPKNQRSVVYCTAIKHGSSRDWNFLYKWYRNANVAHEEAAVLEALGCSQNTKILKKYLLNALSGFDKSRIRRQDISSVFGYVYTASLQNAEFLINFAYENYQVFYNYYNNYNEIGKLIMAVLKRYPVKRLVDKVEGIVKENATHIQPSAQSITNELNIVKQEIDFFNKYLSPAINSIKGTKLSSKNRKEGNKLIVQM